MLAEAWGRPFTTPESMIGAMVNVLLPERFESTESNADRVRDALDEAGFEVPIYAATARTRDARVAPDLLRPRRRQAPRRRGDARSRDGFTVVDTGSLWYRLTRARRRNAGVDTIASSRCASSPRSTSSGARRAPPTSPMRSGRRAGSSATTAPSWRSPTAARVCSTRSAAPIARRTVTGPLGTPVDAALAAAPRHGDHRDGAGERARAGRRGGGQRPDGGHDGRHRRADRRRARPPERSGSSSDSAGRRRPTAGSARCGRSVRRFGCAASSCSSPAT